MLCDDHMNSGLDPAAEICALKTKKATWRGVSGMLSRPFSIIFPVRQNLTGVAAQMTFVYIFVLLIAGEGSLGAQSVQTGHYAPGWNGNLKAGMMAPGD